ncbi:50S ribosomal protein L24e [Candidatus Micrarchaeota archaeon]|nr:50S ribosomal protein L24e [Candidatus Micrarchaeota archaeon]
MKCSFCGEEIDRGTGFVYVKKDGKALQFCSQKCKKNLIILKRKNKKTKWTKHVKDKKIEEHQKKSEDKKTVTKERPKRKKSKR